ncbi:MAG TPA: amidohydrolase family protein [Catalimonadaceae bacterium]|nr:amidohydrolase family protein [Catalimonadaceae bacterium]
MTSSIRKTVTLLVIATCFTVTVPLFAQYRLPQAKLSDERTNEFVLVNATLVPEPGQKIDSASIYIKDGIVVAAGKGIAYPKNLATQDLKGAWVYASFIDLFSGYGIAPPKPNTDGPFSPGPQYDSRRAGAFAWNQALKPEFDASSVFQPNNKDAEELRKLGFGWVATGSKDGIMRGSSSMVQLGEGTSNELILKSGLFQGLSFQKGQSPQQYPSSQMGAIALLRQTFLDADWYQKALQKETNLALEAINRNRKSVWVFETGQKYEVLRAVNLAKEFNLNLLIKGKGDEYQRMDEIKAAGFPLILSLQFPELPDVEDPLDASQISITDLKHWELAPYNAAMLSAKGIPFVITASDLKDPKSFLTSLRKSVECGLKEEDALAALTTKPASLSGLSAQTGKIKSGYKASFFIASDNIFKKNSQILDHYIAGKRFPVMANPVQEKTGSFRLTLGSDNGFQLKINLKDGKPEFLVLAADTQKIPATGNLESGKINFTCQIKKLDTAARFQFTGWVTNSGYQGWFIGGKSGKTKWNAVSMVQAKDTVPAQKSTPQDKPGDIWYPFQAYGSPKSTTPSGNSWLIKNATVWTNEKEGILSNTDVLIVNGKLQGVGKSLAVPPNTPVIDGTGKHVTSGIIDEHSHIAISKGVNEGSSTTSMEVRIGDVIEADDVNIYRHLAGGVTAVQQLHGSANAIGGQSSLIKLRWGKNPEQLKIEQAPGFIKFALGENVKQSNWGEFNTIRYPQTRMGVEQLLYDAFSQAKAYISEKERLVKSPGVVFRKDLKLETLAEILQKKRFITCHSYVQSEINMLMHVGDSMGFKVNTFTHILEGYKVADKMKKHGAGASTFSDWWAYKMEVKDAIPYNAAMMHKHGLVVAINSDDAEMATRLNQEAAKTIKYGGVSEEDAWKMVTINPARLLHLDGRMGSLKTGKDGDVVIWTDNPLKISAMAEKTFVDGEKLFDLEIEKQKQEAIFTERQRIIQKMLKAKQGGSPVIPAQPKVQHLWHCDDEGEF